MRKQVLPTVIDKSFVDGSPHFEPKGKRLRAQGRAKDNESEKDLHGPLDAPEPCQVTDPPMLPFRLIYHPRYDLNLGAHVFPSQKYRLIRDRLLAEGFAGLDDFEQPDPATDEQVLLVHDEGWMV